MSFSLRTQNLGTVIASLLSTLACGSAAANGSGSGGLGGAPTDGAGATMTGGANQGGRTTNAGAANDGNTGAGAPNGGNTGAGAANGGAGTRPVGTGGASGSGGMGGTAGATSGGAASGGSGGGSTCPLGTTFEWTTGAPVVAPKSDATHDLVAVKDPTVVRYGDRFHLFASSVTKAGAYNMVYLSFASWSEAAAAPFYYMSQTPGFDIYTAAPQVFYFTPQKKWYLIFQSGPPMYSTNDDITAPSKWTKPAPFYAAEPAIITQNDGWLDYWVICDANDCHLFFSDDHGRWYKAKTSIASFPKGFGDPTIVMQDAEAGRLFEGSSVYQVRGSSKYLALIEAFDQSSNWRRYFRSWTADSLDGPWQPLADSGTNPFVGKSNVTFTGSIWTNDISHGDMVRTGYDERQSIDPCAMQFVYQGFDPAADGRPYNSLPWHLGLLTRKNK